MKSKWLMLALAGSALLALADTAYAQGWRGGRGGTSFGIQTPYFSGYYGRGGYGRGYGYGGYGYGGYGYGNRGYGYGYPGYYSSPGYYSYEAPVYVEPSPEFAIDSTNMPARQSFYSGPTLEQNKALVHIRVPDAQAKVWIENTLTDRTGVDRWFVSPELESGKKYVYTIKATWMENGQEKAQEKRVDVAPGRQVAVAFGGNANENSGTNIRRSGFDDRYLDPNERNREAPKPLPERKANVREKVESSSMSGKLVQAANGEIIMTDMQGNDKHSHRLAADAQIIINGQKAAIGDLKAGDEIRVVTKEGDENSVTKVEVKVKGGSASPKDNNPKITPELLPPS